MIKQKFTILLSNFTPRDKYPRKRKTRPHQDPYTNVHSSNTPNRQKTETAQMSINRWMEKQNVSEHTMEYDLATKGMKYWYKLHGWALKTLR